MANTLDIIINFIKKGTGDTQATSGLTKLSDGFKQLTGFSMGAAGAIGIAAVGIKKIADFTKEAITETVSYNKSIREMTQVTGLGADEISRIVQVGDDWGISLESLRTSLAFMNKQGISPSIDNLAELADEYVNTTDKAAFAEKAVKVLGRGYQTLIPLLALGGKGFRDAAAGIDKSLIATDKGIAASREYEVVMDDLNDTVQGLKYQLANGLIPTLTDLLETVNKSTKRITDEEAAWDLLQKMHNEELITQGELIKGYLELSSGLEDLEDVTNEYNAELAELKENYEKTYPEEERFIQLNKDLNTATEEATTHATSYGDQLHYVRESTGEAREGIIELTSAVIDNTGVIEDETAAMADVEFLIRGDLTKTTEDYIQTQSDLEQQMADVRAEMVDNYSPALQSELDELTAKYDENATEHEADTKRILWDLLVTKLEMAGLLDSGLYEAMAEEWGYVADAEIEARINADQAINWLRDHPEDVAGAKRILEGQVEPWGLVKEEAANAKQEAINYYQALSNLEGKVVNTTINTYHNDYYEETGKPGPGGHYASGADFIVPPGYYNDNYPIYAQSGERVIIQPATTNNFSINMSGYGNAGQDLISSVRLLELLYG